MVGAGAEAGPEIQARAVPAVREGGLPPVDRHRRGLLLRHHPLRRLLPRIGRLREPDAAAPLPTRQRGRGRETEQDRGLASSRPRRAGHRPGPGVRADKTAGEVGEGAEGGG